VRKLHRSSRRTFAMSSKVCIMDLQLWTNRRAQLATSQPIRVLMTFTTQLLIFLERQHPMSQSIYFVHARTWFQELLGGMSIEILTFLYFQCMHFI